MQDYCFPPHIPLLKEMAIYLYSKRDPEKTRPVSHNWHLFFLEREPELGTKYSYLRAKNRHLFWNSYFRPIWRIAERPLFSRSMMAGNLELVTSVDESNFYKQHLIVLIQSNNGHPRSTGEASAICHSTFYINLSSWAPLFSQY